MDTLNKLKVLEVDKKYTIVGMGEFGFPYQFQMTLIEVRWEPYAQYQESALLIFRVPRKRNLRQVRFYNSRPFIVWEGWVSPDTEMYPFQKVKDYGTSGMVTLRSGFPCFDPRYMQIALDSVKQPPVAVRFDEVKAAAMNMAGEPGE